MESACKILKDCFTKSEPLSKSIAALDNTESTLLSAYKRYDSCTNDYLDFLAHSRVSGSTQELEDYWPGMTNIKKQYSELMEKVHKKESAEAKSHKS